MKLKIKVYNDVPFDPNVHSFEELGITEEQARKAINEGRQMFIQDFEFVNLHIADPFIMGMYQSKEDEEEGEIRLMTITGEYVIEYTDADYDRIYSVIEARTPGSNLIA